MEFYKDRSNAVFILYICRVNWKWYIPLLVVVLAFVSAGMKQSATDPNQEIVVQFYTDVVSDGATQDVISDISHQLELLGVQDVRISKMSDGSLKIVYYSTLAVSVVKKTLREKNRLPIHSDTFPQGENPFELPVDGGYGYYILDVAKIQNDVNNDTSVQGVMVEVNVLLDQPIKPKKTSQAVIWIFDYASESKKTNDAPFLEGVNRVDKTSYLIPEVRAGPIS